MRCPSYSCFALSGLRDVLRGFHFTLTDDFLTLTNDIVTSTGNFVRAIAYLMLLLAIDACAILAEDVSLPTYQREPFDRITLDKANDNFVLEVYPVDLPGRVKPVNPSPARKLQVRRLQDPPDRLFEVAWAHIDKLELFEEILRDEAAALVAERKFDEAFHYYALLVEHYPETEGLEAALDVFHMGDAGAMFRQGRFDEALLELDEAYQRNPDRSGLDQALSRVVNRVIAARVEAGDYPAARKTISYARQRYGSATDKVVESWIGRLSREAAERMRQAREHLAAGELAEAFAACHEMLGIWPELEGASQLRQQILQRYPRIVVGVEQPYVESAEPLLLNWSRRRAAPLVRRGLVEFAEFTAEGGRYTSPIGDLQVSDEGRTLALRLDQARNQATNGFQIAQALLRAADASQPEFDAGWAELLKNVTLDGVYTVTCGLTRAHLRPEALLPRELPGHDDLRTALVGPYESGALAGNENQFVLRNRGGAQLIQEIVEQVFSAPEEEAEALLRGQIDALDRVYPAVTNRLRTDPLVTVAAYRIPSIHFLAINPRHPLLRGTVFRRGLLHGINREGILLREIQSGINQPGTQVISAPLPVGLAADDPLGYAYDTRISARPYEPSLASVLLRLSQSQLPATADNASPSRTPAQLPELVLVHPGTGIARIASRAIVANFDRIGLKCTTRELPPGRAIPDDDEWDLLYVDAVIQEPFVDVPRLLLDETIARDVSSHLRQALRILQLARNWEDAREQLRAVHKILYDEVPLIPLWQVADHFAHRQQLEGIGNRPVSLYQNITQWQIGP